jgi:uncharacterized membrane protein YcaP (DUF421 family)
MTAAAERLLSQNTPPAYLPRRERPRPASEGARVNFRPARVFKGRQTGNRPMLQSIFFSGWDPIIRTVVSTVTTYVALVALIRLAGSRVLAKWYAFDLIVTVALGSAFASGLMSETTTVTQALTGFVLLIALQFAVSWGVLHWSALRVVVNPRPSLILHDGRFLDDSMRRQRVGEADVRAAVRSHGFASLDDVDAVILEADGTFSVIERLSGDCSALDDIPELGGTNKANKSK